MMSLSPVLPVLSLSPNPLRWDIVEDLGGLTRSIAVLLLVPMTDGCASDPGGLLLVMLGSP